MQPERDQQRRHQHRAEREADVAAHAEQAHAACPPRARDVVGEARSLGMERGDAEPADQHGGERERVAGSEPDERDAQAAERGAERHQPGQRESVGHVPEQRLDHRRGDRGGEHERGGGGDADVVAGDQERQQRGDRALRDVGEHVAGRQDRHRAAVDAAGRCRDRAQSSMPARRRWTRRRLASSSDSSCSSSRRRRRTSSSWVADVPEGLRADTPDLVRVIGLLDLAPERRPRRLGLEQRRDLLQREAEQVAQAHDLAHALDVGLRVAAVLALGAVGAREQADLFVVADRARGGAEQLGHLADAKRLDLRGAHAATRSSRTSAGPTDASGTLTCAGRAAEIAAPSERDRGQAPQRGVHVGHERNQLGVRDVVGQHR